MTGNQLRIVVDALNLSHGGGTVVMGRIVDALAAQGAKVTVLVAREHALEVVRGTRAEAKYYPQASGAARSLWFRHRHMGAILADRSAQGLVGFNYYTPSNIPQITYFFNAIPFLPFRERIAKVGVVRAMVQNLSARAALQRSTLKVFESEYLRDAARETAAFGEEAIVAYAGIDIPPMAGARSAPPADPLVCMITSGAPHKRNTLAVRTFFAFWERYPTARLEVFGRKEDILASLSTELRARCLSCDGVIFRGYVDRETLYRTLATASALLTASELESFYMVALEAMVVGCPVVAADISSVRESTGAVGRLFDLDDGDAVLGHLLDLHRAEVWASASQDGYDWAKGFDADRLTRDFALRIINTFST